MFITSDRCPVCYQKWGDGKVCPSCGGQAEIYYERDLPLPESIDAERLQGVIEAARIRLAKYPDDGNARYVLGLNYVHLGLLPEGITEIKKAADLLPEKVQIRYEAAALSAMVGIFNNEVLDEVNKVLARQPDFKQALYLKGVIQEELGNIPLAVRAWQQAYNLDQDYKPATFRLSHFTERERPYLKTPTILRSLSVAANVDENTRALLKQLSAPLPSSPPPLGKTSMRLLHSISLDTARRMRKIHTREVQAYQNDLSRRDLAWEELESDIIAVSDVCIVSYELRQRQPTPRKSGVRMLTVAERSAILEDAIQRYQKGGFHLVSRTDTSAQLYRPKQFSCCLAIILVFLVIGIILYLIYYLTKKDDSVFLEVDEYGALRTTHT